MTALVDRAVIERNADKVLERVSPSQVDLFELCPRRWYNAHIRGLREEMTPAAQRGTDVATLVENYYLHGTEPEADEARKHFAPLARAVFPIYGPRRSSITAEEWVVMSTEPGLPVVRGRYDFFDPHPKASTFMKGFEDAGGVEVLGDTKCRSSFRYAKSADPKDGDDKYIGADQQLNTYASALVEGLGLSRIGLLHAYSLTDARRPPKGMPVGIVVTADQLVPRRRKTIESVREMAEWAKARPETADPLTPNTLACSQFRPKGCPYRGLCGIDATLGSWAADEAKPQENATMENRQGPTLMERMKAERDRLAAGGAAPAETTPREAAPTPAPAPAAAATSAPGEEYELDVARARALAEQGIIKFDGGTTNIFTKQGSTSWTLRAGTPAEIEGIQLANAAKAAKASAPAAAPAAAAPAGIRAPDAPPATNQAGDPPPTEGKKSKKPPRAPAPAAENPAAPAAAEATPTPAPTVARSAPASGEPVRVATEKEAATSKAGAPKGIVLYLDCLPSKGEHAGKTVDYNEWLEPIAAQAAKSLGLVDWRLDFANKSEGALAAGIRANLHTLPLAITVSGYSKARSVFLECVAPVAAAVVKGISG